jgi:integration host factor subunit alpha
VEHVSLTGYLTHKDGNMTKADIVEKICLATCFTKKESAEVVESVFDLVKSTLGNGEKIKIAGFGNFEVKEKAARCGRNPQTGEAIEITPRKVLTFKPSQVLKKSLNGV